MEQKRVISKAAGNISIQDACRKIIAKGEPREIGTKRQTFFLKFIKMKKRTIKLVSMEEKIAMDIQRSHSDRIVELLKLIRLSNLVSEAGAKYRKR